MNVYEDMMWTVFHLGLTYGRISLTCLDDGTFHTTYPLAGRGYLTQ